MIVRGPDLKGGVVSPAVTTTVTVVGATPTTESFIFFVVSLCSNRAGSTGSSVSRLVTSTSGATPVAVAATVRSI